MCVHKLLLGKLFKKTLFGNLNVAHLYDQGFFFSFQRPHLFFPFRLPFDKVLYFASVS